MHALLTSLRIAAATLAVCVVGYAGAILALAQLVLPESANGSLILREDGSTIGSRLIAQRFAEARYFWPRPSAVDYDASGSGGSNESPTSPALTERAQALIARYGAAAEHPLPPELAAASGSGLDPHISEQAALYQAPRVSTARSIELAQIEALVRKQAYAPGGLLTSDRIVNVLELNLALDRETGER